MLSRKNQAEAVRGQQRLDRSDAPAPAARRASLAEATLLPFVSEHFDRGGGPGGQNVNKVATRVVLLFDFQNCASLQPAERERIRTRCVNRLSADGRLRIVAASERSQRANRQAAIERLIAVLERALHVEKHRTATRPTAGSRERRLAAKRRRSQTKQQRRGETD